ncbi:SDR family oxidoreductase [Pseudooceanicola sp. C21-150M6]|uniref:SDR family oxidoreductase n=1 Tax=Pseudooceanicola sp. C21-150M6 TaxID=3434355 RepID=UPI003D7FF1AE
MGQRTALVTGAAHRLGKAIALDLAAQGYDVAVHYNGSEEAAQAVALRIREMGRSAITLQADLTQEAEVQRLVPAAVEGLGAPLLCLVNNASLFDRDDIWTATRDSWDRHMECNLRAPFVLSQGFAAQVPDPLPDRHGEPVAQGLIVNMLDQAVQKLTPNFMTYLLSKTGLWTLTQTMAQALAPRVRVNGIGPGPTLKNARQDEAAFRKLRRLTVLERGTDPDDVLATLRYFLSTPAVTGQLICPDGGQRLAWKTPDIQWEL